MPDTDSEFKGQALPLKDSDFERAAARLGCEVAAIRAVAEVESGGRSGFLPDKRPKILFESRWFHKLTGGRYDASHGGISTPTWVRNYRGGAAEYQRLNEAIALDREAALKSTSWGMFQILGVNFAVAGFGDVQAYVTAQLVSEGAHLDAFAGFVTANRLDDELRDRRWSDFARGYNGPGYRQNRYDEKMADAYARYSGGAIAPTTLDVQRALNARGANLDTDGKTGPLTRAAIREFQRDAGLPITGVADPATLAALGLSHDHDPVATSARLNDV
ncbi:hypothetical protein GCM10017083_07850 [Thalassobaculum fulvum]|uniref:DUF3380 domain-containing protein n=1 Tax=Thalassobaculum fulvum TaxID=1633335 RepID=A0A919CNL0_9PROT|nr:N-acetylmuramidase domain-containing protein [Thalassobaculum fulvum]GHD42625.1 hypothetical protein GCM10017083_07850 [Thalassobaculum fulvum]